MYKNKLIVTTIVASIGLSGCANMSKEQQAGLGAGLGALAGAGLGALIGGEQGAAIGAAAGLVAGGAVAYALASDPYTQSAAQQAESWRKEIGSEPEVVKVSNVTENGQSRQQIDRQEMLLSDTLVVSNNRLSPKILSQLVSAHKSALKTGGYVHVYCPANAPASVISDIDSTGVNYSKDNTIKSGYKLVLTRSQEKFEETRI